MQQYKILFAISEVEGLAKSGGLADVGYALPKALAARGCDVRVICPYYRQIREAHPMSPVVAKLRFSLPGKEFHCQVRALKQGEVTVYAIDYPAYFDRQGMYADHYDGYSDNGQRFAFFSLACLEAAQALEFSPDIIHTNDWQTGPLTLFLKQRFADSPFFANTRSVLSIHNAAYQGLHHRHELKLDGELPDDVACELSRDDGLLNLLQCGVASADALVAVSPTYAEELLTPLGAHGLYTSFKARPERLSGILNGCDYDTWDPASDEHLPARYQASDLSGKAVCKSVLQREMDLPQRADLPLFSMVCRLTDQKGVSLLLRALEHLVQQPLQIAIIGSGDPFLSNQLTDWAGKHPEQLAFFEGYSEQLSHLAYAGSDFFLMPSLFEPCGLAQMYALAYGSLPVVRQVGGLRDTVNGYSQDAMRCNGFSFAEPNGQSLAEQMRLGAEIWHNSPMLYRQIQQRAMATRFTWNQAVDHYLALYQQLLIPPLARVVNG